MLEVRVTTTMGRGVFALRDIAAGEVLGIFHALRLPPAEVKAIAGGELSRFWFEDDSDGSAYVVFGLIELTNHSATPNADRRWHRWSDGYTVELFALGTIAAGDQLFIDYKFAGTADDPAWSRT